LGRSCKTHLWYRWPISMCVFGVSHWNTHPISILDFAQDDAKTPLGLLEHSHHHGPCGIAVHWHALIVLLPLPRQSYLSILPSKIPDQLVHQIQLYSQCGYGWWCSSYSIYPYICGFWCRREGHSISTILGEQPSKGKL
jgi:hypothetical protein